MKKIASYSFVLCLIAALGCFSGDAMAKKDKKHGHKQGKEASSVIKIGANDRDAIKSYLKKTHGKKCPPGLAKKNNGCLPPGIAKKYSVGQPLPKGVFASPLSAELLKFLYPAPVGHRYVQVDKDVLLINSATEKVIDAVTALSALGS